MFRLAAGNLLQSTRQSLFSSSKTLAVRGLASSAKWTDITEENREIARQRLLERSKKYHIDWFDEDFEHATPDAGLLQELNKLDRGYDVDNFVDEHEEDEALAFRKKGYVRQIVSVDRVQKVTTQGKILRYRALVVVGNQNGAAGFAIGKAGSVPEAVLKGTRKAVRDFVHVDRLDNRTLYHEVNGKFNSCRLFLKPTKNRNGTIASDVVEACTYCFGITDITSKVHGQRNPFTVVAATFDALAQHETAEEYALKTGQSLVELQKDARHRR